MIELLNILYAKSDIPVSNSDIYCHDRIIWKINHCIRLTSFLPPKKDFLGTTLQLIYIGVSRFSPNIKSIFNTIDITSIATRYNNGSLSTLSEKQLFQSPSSIYWYIMMSHIERKTKQIFELIYLEPLCVCILFISLFFT